MGWAFLILGVLGTLLLRAFTELRFREAYLPMMLSLGGVFVLVFRLLFKEVATRLHCDRSTGQIVLRGLRFSPPVTLEMENVIAVQLCSCGKTHIGESSFRTRTYQINFVLGRDPLERFHVFECGGLKSMRILAIYEQASVKGSAGRLRDYSNHLFGVVAGDAPCVKVRAGPIHGCEVAGLMATARGPALYPAFQSIIGFSSMAYPFAVGDDRDYHGTCRRGGQGNAGVRPERRADGYTAGKARPRAGPFPFPLAAPKR